MWQRFTERARKVIFFAQEEARKLGENYVSTEHLLLGIIRDTEIDSVAMRVLILIGIDTKQIASEIERQVAHGDGRLDQDMQLTPRAKRVIDLAYDELTQLNNNYIGTEHLLLGLIREGQGLAGRVLAKVGANLDQVRFEVRLIQGGNPSEAQTRPQSTATDKRLLYNEIISAIDKVFSGESQREEDKQAAQAMYQETAVVEIAKAILQEAMVSGSKSIVIEYDLTKTHVKYLNARKWVTVFVLPRFLFELITSYYKQAAVEISAENKLLQISHTIGEQVQFFEIDHTTGEQGEKLMINAV